jgi:hypothetical protein
VVRVTRQVKLHGCGRSCEFLWCIISNIFLAIVPVPFHKKFSKACFWARGLQRAVGVLREWWWLWVPHKWIFTASSSRNVFLEKKSKKKNTHKVVVEGVATGDRGGFYFSKMKQTNLEFWIWPPQNFKQTIHILIPPPPHTLTLICHLCYLSC